jgi:hypothetical protein
MQNLRSYDIRKTFFSSDKWVNLQVMFPDFVQLVQFAPSKVVIAVPKEALPILKDRSCLMFVDGTFSLVQEELTVTTVLYQIEGIGLPVAWLVHKDKSEDSYKFFFDYLQQLTKHQMRPAAVFGDFEKAIRNAAQRSFDKVLFYGDY